MKEIQRRDRRNKGEEIIKRRRTSRFCSVNSIGVESCSDVDFEILVDLSLFFFKRNSFIQIVLSKWRRSRCDLYFALLLRFCLAWRLLM